MAYQSVGIPRFYVSWGDWWKSAGWRVPRWHTISPTRTEKLTFTPNNINTNVNSWGEVAYYHDDPLRRSTYVPYNTMDVGINYVAVLNHNYGAYGDILGRNTVFHSTGQSGFGGNTGAHNLIEMCPVFKTWTFYGDNFTCLNAENLEQSVNIIGNDTDETRRNTYYDGWSLWTFPSNPIEEVIGGYHHNEVDEAGNLKYQVGYGSGLQVVTGLQFRTKSPNMIETFNNIGEEMTFDIGCFVYGKYYDMPHSADLKISMTREVDGVNRQRTMGGNDLVNHRYTKPSQWKNRPQFDLGRTEWKLLWGYTEGVHQDDYTEMWDTQQAVLSRTGRRVWDLNFTYLQGEDILPMSESAGFRYGGLDETNFSPMSNNQDGTYSYNTTHSGTDNNLINGNSFIGSVLNKTNGGQLPFLFQPDRDNFLPDSFAIAKFDMKTFSFKQVANGVYNIKLKIREVW
tara:strand:- start:1222 stop:2583 length:1362 start_codon:yes stop_codon:yes gene_type:complete